MNDDSTGKEDQDISFEEAFTALEQIVRRLEGEEVSLSDSLQLFEKGIALSRTCAAKLDAAEGKIRLLTSDGQLQHVALDPETGGLSTYGEENI